MNIQKLGSFLFHWLLPLAVLGVAGTSVMMLGQKAKPNRKKAPPRISVPVDVVKAQRHTGPLTITTTGVAVPFREVQLATEVGGRIAWKSDALLPGTFVNAGDELVRIERADYELEVARLEQQLAKAESDLAKTKVDKENEDRMISLAMETRELRTRELDRMNRLRNSQATSDTEYDAAEKMLLEAKQSLTIHENVARGLVAEAASLELAKQLAEIELKKAKMDLERTVIRAPMSGVVIDHAVEANAHVQPGDPIAMLEDTSKVEVRCNLRKEDLDFLPHANWAPGEDTGTPQPPPKQRPKQRPKPQQGGTPRQIEADADAYRLPQLPVTIRYTRAGQTYCWAGVLSRQDGLGMDERTRTMPVRIVVDKPRECKVISDSVRSRGLALVRGMFVQVDLHCETRRPLLVIPEDTVRPGKTVWIMEDQQLKITPIHVARIESGMAYVDTRDGNLLPHHEIIRSPVPGAKEGLAVTKELPKKPGGRGAGKGGKSPGRKPQSTADASGEKRVKPAKANPAKVDAVTLASDEGHST